MKNNNNYPICPYCEYNVIDEWKFLIPYVYVDSGDTVDLFEMNCFGCKKNFQVSVRKYYNFSTFQKEE